MQDKVTFLKFTIGTATALKLAGKGVRRIASDELFGDVDEIVIEHGGKFYLLSKKRLGGLVLTGLDDPNQ